MTNSVPPGVTEAVDGVAQVAADFSASWVGYVVSIGIIMLAFAFMLFLTDRIYYFMNRRRFSELNEWAENKTGKGIW